MKHLCNTSYLKAYSGDFSPISCRSPMQTNSWRVRLHWKTSIEKRFVHQTSRSSDFRKLQCWHFKHLNSCGKYLTCAMKKMTLFDDIQYLPRPGFPGLKNDWWAHAVFPSRVQSTSTTHRLSMTFVQWKHNWNVVRNDKTRNVKLIRVFGTVYPTHYFLLRVIRSIYYVCFKSVNDFMKSQLWNWNICALESPTSKWKHCSFSNYNVL